MLLDPAWVSPGIFSRLVFSPQTHCWSRERFFFFCADPCMRLTTKRKTKRKQKKSCLEFWKSLKQKWRHAFCECPRATKLTTWPRSLHDWHRRWKPSHGRPAIFLIEQKYTSCFDWLWSNSSDTVSPSLFFYTWNMKQERQNYRTLLMRIDSGNGAACPLVPCWWVIKDRSNDQWCALFGCRPYRSCFDWLWSKRSDTVSTSAFF